MEGKNGGTSIPTFSGRWLDLANPSSGRILLVDIVHSLGNLCRNVGQGGTYYSVAEHSCIVCDVLMARTGSSRLGLLGLFHDAAEAYINDLSRPLKNLVPAVRVVEDQVQAEVWRAMRIDPPTDDETAGVKGIDVALYEAEKEALFYRMPGGSDIHAAEGDHVSDSSLVGRIEFWPALRASKEFMIRARTLGVRV